MAEVVLSGQGGIVIVCWDSTETSRQNVIPDRCRTDVPLIVAIVENKHYCHHGCVWREVTAWNFVLLTVRLDTSV